MAAQGPQRVPTGVVTALLQERPPGASHRLRCVSLRYARGPTRKHGESEAEKAAGLRPPLFGAREDDRKPEMDKHDIISASKPVKDREPTA